MSWNNRIEHGRIVGRPWRRLREQVFKRDGFLCVLCKAKGRLTVAAVCDHRKPLAKGGTNDMDNLQSLCGPCDEAKTRIDNGAKPVTGCNADGWPTDPDHGWNR